MLELPNGLANGVRTASDFLMALQLTGAAKRRLAREHAGALAGRRGRRRPDRDRHRDRVARLLPGAGREVPGALRGAGRREHGRDAVEAAWTADEQAIAEEFLTHARAIRAERAAAAREQRDPDIVELLQRWGGVTIAYRRRLIDSPSYTLNHEEVEKALEEGIRFAEGLTPLAIEVDAARPRAGSRCRRITTTATASGTSRRATLPARTILIAAGTQPNTVLAREDAGRTSSSTASISGCSTRTAAR